MHINRGLLFWGLALVTGGAVALAVQLDYVDRGVVSDAWRLWPLILVAIGLAIVLSRTPFAVLGTVAAALVVGVAGGALLTVGPGVVACGSSDPTSLQPHDGSFSADAVTTRLDFNCGTLRVAMAPGSDWSAKTGSTRSGASANVSSSGNALTISSPQGSFDFAGNRQRWEVTLGSNPTYDLQVSPNAADANLDLASGAFSHLGLSLNAGSVTMNLAGATVDDIALSMNAGSFSISVDGDTSLDGGWEANAGSLELCTTTETAVRLTVDANFTFSHNLDGSGLSRDGDTWTSANYAAATKRVTLTLSGNAASFSLNPNGGCS